MVDVVTDVIADAGVGVCVGGKGVCTGVEVDIVAGMDVVIVAGVAVEAEFCVCGSAA